MDKKRILILGAGVMQLPALRWAVDQGWFVSVADGNPRAVGAAAAHRFINVDLTDIEGMITAASELQAREGLDGVFTAGTDFSYTVARVAEALALPGLSPDVAYKATNKAEMRKIFLEKGVASPRFCMLEKEDSEDKALGELRFPLVVKPVDNMGARGIRRIDTDHEYGKAVKEARRFSRCGTIVVEEYIEGPEFSIDALVSGGRIHYTGIADRHIHFPPYFIEMGHTIPTRADETILAGIKKTFESAVHAIGIDNGAAKGDVKWDGTRAVIGEIAARLSGGYMSGWTYPYCSGVELTGAALLQAVGAPLGGLHPSRKWFSAERAFISIPGIVASVEQGDAAKRLPWVKDLFVRVKKGDIVDFPTNNVEKCGNCIASAEDRDTAVHAAEEACRTVFVRLEPGNELTESFLFRNAPSWIPRAFPLEREENITALKNMREFRVGKGSPAEGSGRADPPLRGLPASRGTRIALSPLPHIEGESSIDWHGISFSRALELVQSYSRAVLVEEENDADIILGSLFWNAFSKGGIQAGVWLLDTISEKGMRGF